LAKVGSEFLTDYLAGDDTSEEILPSPDNDNITCTNFTYEKDLKSSLCNQISALFPGYKIFGENKEGIEYAIEGKRIDVLLENIATGSLLVIELKSGVADFRVFGQIAVYLGLLKRQFPDRKAEGVIISGEVDDSLRNACLITEAISLKTYKMTLNLENA
jgi:RecB family endonuclease NucS